MTIIPLTVHSAGVYETRRSSQPKILMLEQGLAASDHVLTSERNVRNIQDETPKTTPRRCQRTCKRNHNRNALKNFHPSLKDIQHSHEPDQTRRERRHLALPIKYLEDTHHMRLTASPHHAWPRLQNIEFLSEEMPLLLHLKFYHAGLAADGEQLSDR
jgi:hypothetical protein